jgi:ribonuclease HI
MSDEIILYTDGSARGNPGRGGYGVLLMSGNRRKELSKGFRLTTNNRMELMAVIEGLKALKKENLKISVYTDSKYVANAVELGWLKNWIATQFKGGKKNRDLWMEYHELSKKHKIKFHWVKGHADNPFNNRCDVLATEAADGSNLDIDHFYEQENAKLL